ncbi:unnamed protein product [Caenorhabditis bovis]|uniref:Tyrosinase copper-binding domain-containing protein n=1 Tax=Caenorhabditis bovis TaxID=2654633 RepID=A0A8S1F500_9PELO|nr:unnamed protein product [Caenorhabditis bovis]
MLRQLLIFLWLILMSFSKFDSCDQWIQQIGDLDFFTEAQIRLICMHKKEWTKDRDTEASRKFIESTTENQLKYLRSVEHCTRKNCVRDARRKKRAPTKSIRKEIRMLTPRELRNLAIAMNGLKNRNIDNITAWDLHTLVHYPDSAPGAHWGPAFLPWHREFLRQFEIALQTEVPTVTLPYWDSTLDQGLPEESDSVLWTAELLGNGNGYVKTGPFANWDTNVLMPMSQVPVKKLYRFTGGRPQDRLMTPRDANWIITRKNFSQLTFCHDKTFETMHGLSHVWVGGFMYVIRVSPNDPAFYMHHAFIDNLWEQFRQNSQTREERENQWKNCNKNHGYDVQMKPFTIQNRDGLSNQYTDEWYEYEPVRHCTPDSATCDSQYLWCDSDLWRCRSKIVYGGNCTGYEGTQICYNSVCSKGTCVVPPRIRTGTRLHIEDKNEEWKESVWAKTVMIDENGSGVIDDLARITVRDLETNESVTVFNYGEYTFPEISGTVYLNLPKPRGSQTKRVSLEAVDQYGRYCQSQCYNSTSERFQVCQPMLNISMKFDKHVSPISFTHSMSSRTFLDTDLSVHPRLLKPQMPYMVFICARKLITSAMIFDLAESVRAQISRESFVFFRITLFRQPFSNYQIEVVPQAIDGPIWTSSVEKATSAFDPNVIFVQAPNPELHRGGVRVLVSILEDNQRVSCTIKCTLKDGSMRECDGNVDLHSDSSLSDEDVFTTDLTALSVLGWNMKGHPTQWRHKVPYLAFHC